MYYVHNRHAILHIVKPSTKSQCNFHCAMLDAGANCWYKVYKEKYSGSGGLGFLFATLIANCYME